MHSTESLQLVEASCRITAQFLNRLAIASGSLPLNFAKRNTLQVRFSFQHTKSITGLDTPNLSGITAEDDSRRFVFSKLQHFGHLTTGEHTRFVHDQDLSAYFSVDALILQEPLYRNGVGETDFLQFFNRAHRGGNGQHLPPALFETVMQFLQRSRLPRACRTANVPRPIATVENEVDYLLLLRTEPRRGSEFVLATQALKLAHPVIDPRDHVSFLVQTLLGSNFLPSPQDSASPFLQRKLAFQIRQVDPAPAMT